MPNFITRAEAREKLEEQGNKRWKYLRNYEIEYHLNTKFDGGHETETAFEPDPERQWVINEICPFDGHWSAWGRLTEEGRAFEAAYNQHTKCLYALDACPHCGHAYWGRDPNTRRPTKPGPDWSAECSGCKKVMFERSPTLFPLAG